jgi:hypothetical protein
MNEKGADVDVAVKIIGFVFLLLVFCRLHRVVVFFGLVGLLYWIASGQLPSPLLERMLIGLLIIFIGLVLTGLFIDWVERP